MRIVPLFSKVPKSIEIFQQVYCHDTEYLAGVADDKEFTLRDTRSSVFVNGAGSFSSKDFSAYGYGLECYSTLGTAKNKKLIYLSRDKDSITLGYIDPEKILLDLIEDKYPLVSPKAKNIVSTSGVGVLIAKNGKAVSCLGYDYQRNCFEMALSDEELRLMEKFASTDLKERQRIRATCKDFKISNNIKIHPDKTCRIMEVAKRGVGQLDRSKAGNSYFEL